LGGKQVASFFSLNYTDADFDTVLQRFVAAARSMQADGWWWQDRDLSNKSIRRAVLRETLARKWQELLA